MENNKVELNYINNGSVDKTYFTRSFNKKAERFGHKILDFNNDEFILTKEAKIGISFNGKRMLKRLFKNKLSI